MPNLQGFQPNVLSLQEQKLLTGQAAMARPAVVAWLSADTVYVASAC